MARWRAEQGHTAEPEPDKPVERPAHGGVSVRCGCKASITVQLAYEYARDLKLAGVRPPAPAGLVTPAPPNPPAAGAGQQPPPPAPAGLVTPAPPNPPAAGTGQQPPPPAPAGLVTPAPPNPPAAGAGQQPPPPAPAGLVTPAPPNPPAAGAGQQPPPPAPAGLVTPAPPNPPAAGAGQQPPPPAPAGLVTPAPPNPPAAGAGQQPPPPAPAGLVTPPPAPAQPATAAVVDTTVHVWLRLEPTSDRRPLQEIQAPPAVRQEQTQQPPGPAGKGPRGVADEGPAFGNVPNPRLYACSQQEVTAAGYMTLDRQAAASGSWPPGLPAPSQLAALSSDQVAVLPEGSAAWKLLRAGRLTASVFGTMLGFKEKDACGHLDVSKAWVDHEAAVQLYAELRGQRVAASQVLPEFEWGLAHEANCRLLLLRKLTETPWFRAAQSVELREVGFLPWRPPSFVILPSQMGVVPLTVALPPMGASSDDILVVQQAGGEVLRIAAEYKASFPFVKDSSGAAAYKYLGGAKRLPQTLPPMYYAQVQLAMQACSATHCVLVYYGINKSKLYLVARDDAWCSEALAFASSFWGRQAAPPENFGVYWGGEQYIHFLKETAKRCAAVANFELASMRGGENARFLA
ncbi:hypothetical protein PLESTF_000165000 [Pleodorina starrii]|nr:hypothetical protein PLESTF_000165000 [Pleodorina starrii]